MIRDHTNETKRRLFTFEEGEEEEEEEKGEIGKSKQTNSGMNIFIILK